jgi:hypothetical protein
MMGARNFLTNTREPGKATIRLVVTPESAGRFTARMEGMGELIVSSTRQPLVDGARVLLAQGYDPGALLTMRHEGKAYDSFQPLPIGKWAGWTYKEGEKDALRRTAWMPLPTDRGWQKSGSEPLVVPEGQETENRFHGGARQQQQLNAPLAREASP